MLLRATRGRVATFPMAPNILLTVPGRKSGQPRSTTLLYFTEGDEVILMASQFGRTTHPQWYFNVMAHPEVTLTVRGASYRYVAARRPARSATGSTRRPRPSTPAGATTRSPRATARSRSWR